MQSKRLNLLQESCILLSSNYDIHYERFIALATRIFNVKAATLSLITTDVVRYKFPTFHTSIKSYPLISSSIGLYLYPESPDIIVIEDILLDTKFKVDEFLVSKAKIRFFAAAVLSIDNIKFGFLELHDDTPRNDFLMTQKMNLFDLASALSIVISERRTSLLNRSALRYLRQTIQKIDTISISNKDIENEEFFDLTIKNLHTIENDFKKSRNIDLKSTYSSVTNSHGSSYDSLEVLVQQETDNEIKEIYKSMLYSVKCNVIDIIEKTRALLNKHFQENDIVSDIYEKITWNYDKSYLGNINTKHVCYPDVIMFILSSSTSFLLNDNNNINIFIGFKKSHSTANHIRSLDVHSNYNGIMDGSLTIQIHISTTDCKSNNYHSQDKESTVTTRARSPVTGVYSSDDNGHMAFQKSTTTKDQNSAYNPVVMYNSKFREIKRLSEININTMRFSMVQPVLESIGGYYRYKEFKKSDDPSFSLCIKSQTKAINPLGNYSPSKPTASEGLYDYSIPCLILQIDQKAYQLGRQPSKDSSHLSSIQPSNTMGFEGKVLFASSTYKCSIDALYHFFVFQGYTVVVCHNGDRALDLLRTEYFDLAFVDISTSFQSFKLDVFFEWLVTSPLRSSRTSVAVSSNASVVEDFIHVHDNNAMNKDKVLPNDPISASKLSTMSDMEATQSSHTVISPRESDLSISSSVVSDDFNKTSKSNNDNTENPILGNPNVMVIGINGETQMDDVHTFQNSQSESLSLYHYFFPSPMQNIDKLIWILSIRRKFKYMKEVCKVMEEDCNIRTSYSSRLEYPIVSNVHSRQYVYDKSKNADFNSSLRSNIDVVTFLDQDDADDLPSF